MNLAGSSGINGVTSKWDTFAASFASGAGAGMLAAFLTTPFDVVKMQRQVDTGALMG